MAYICTLTECSDVQGFVRRQKRKSSLQIQGPGGTDLERGYGDVPRSWPLFSGQSALPSLPIYHHCAALVPPIFKFLKKFPFFSLVLVKFSALKTQIFKIFVPKTPHFSRKIRSLDPTFGNPCGTHPPKKKLSAPPGSRATRGFFHNSNLLQSAPTWSTYMRTYLIQKSIHFYNENKI